MYPVKRLHRIFRFRVRFVWDGDSARWAGRGAAAPPPVHNTCAFSFRGSPAKGRDDFPPALGGWAGGGWRVMAPSQNRLLLRSFLPGWERRRKPVHSGIYISGAGALFLSRACFPKKSVKMGGKTGFLLPLAGARLLPCDASLEVGRRSTRRFRPFSRLRRRAAGRRQFFFGGVPAREWVSTEPGGTWQARAQRCRARRSDLDPSLRYSSQMV